MTEETPIGVVWRGRCPGCRRDGCVVGFMPHGPIDGGPEVGDFAFAGDQLVEVTERTDDGFAIRTPHAAEPDRTVANEALQFAMPVAVHPAPHCMYFLATDISDFAAAAHKGRGERWASPSYSVELTPERLVLVDADGDRVVMELDARERRALGSALGGFRRRRTSAIQIAPHGVVEVIVTDAHVQLSALVDPTGELFAMQGASATISVLNGLAAKEGSGPGRGQLPAGIQTADLTVPRPVARQLAAALSRSVTMQH